MEPPPSAHEDAAPRPASPLRQVASYIVEARGKRSEERARQAVFRHILDLLCAAMAGSRDAGAVGVRNTVLKLQLTGDVPIWFTGKSTSAEGAAWANSAAASALDIDDGHRLARGHPGSPTIATAFAVGRETNALFEDMITAIVIGTEVGVTLAIERTHYGNTGTWAPYAVVATAAALRGTPLPILEHALAIAGESAPNQQFMSALELDEPPEGSHVKEGIPWSVYTGLMALKLAEAGVTGPRNLLGSAKHYKFPPDLALGSHLHICGAYIKLYACCRHIHAPLEALLRVMDRHKIDNWEMIDAVEVETHKGALRIPNKIAPAHVIDIQYSIPYCLALAALEGPQILQPLRDGALGIVRARELAGKVTLRLAEDIDARFPAETLARVTVIRGDERLASPLTSPSGEASTPLSWEEMEEKFRVFTRFAAGQEEQEDILRAMRATREGDMLPLLKLLEKPAKIECGDKDEPQIDEGEMI